MTFEKTLALKKLSGILEFPLQKLASTVQVLAYEVV
jgi:hypothetical protein